MGGKERRQQEENFEGFQGRKNKIVEQGEMRCSPKVLAGSLLVLYKDLYTIMATRGTKLQSK